MKHIRNGLWLLLALAFLCSAVGCGNGQEEESWISEYSTISQSGSSSGDTTPESSSDGTTVSPDKNGQTGTDNTTRGNGNTAPASGDFNYSSANLKGVTLRRLVWYTPGATEKKMVQDFEKKYGCTIQDVYSTLEDAPTKLVAGMTSGDVIDIATIYGAFFPELIIKNLYQPIDKYVVKDQLMNENDPFAGGFDLDKMENYVWGGHYYGFCSYTNVDLPIVLYNKKIFEDYKQKTPDVLMAENNWNWDTFYSTAKAMTVRDKMAGLSNGSMLWFPAAGVQLITFKDGTPVSNLSDPRVLETLQYYKKLFSGNTAVTQDGYSFFKGRSAMYVGIYSALVLSDANASVQKNLGVAPWPCSRSNTTGRNPTSWSKAIGISRGSLHADAVAVYARWVTNYVDAADALAQFSAEQQEQIKGWYKNALVPNATYGKTRDYAYNLQGDCLKNQDPAQVIANYEGLFAAAIKETIAKS